MTHAYEQGQQAREKGLPIEHGRTMSVASSVGEFERWTAEFCAGWQDKDVELVGCRP